MTSPGSRSSVCTALTAALLALGTSQLTAQQIDGRVVDATSGQPVGVGFIVLLDEAGTEVARALSDRDGRFTVRAPSAGRYRLRSERIGYRAFESDPVPVGPTGSVTFTLEVVALPVRLEAVQIQGRNRCQANPERAHATLVVWEEVRKALAATAWGDEQDIHRYEIYSFERDLSANRREILAERGRAVRAVSTPPFQSYEPTLLADSGYIQSHDGDFWYYAPDARVLLHDSFLNTHCFRVIRDRRMPGQLGLAFEPVRDRDIPDVVGALWLDEATSELRRLEVRYTRLPGRLEDERTGATVQFLMLPSGAWIVQHWVIRTPKIRVEETTGRLYRREALATGFRDIGGEILRVADLDGNTIYTAPLALVSGIVYDSTRAGPLAEALATIAGTDFWAVADDTGAFTLAAPLEGTHDVTLSHPSLDSIGVEPPSHTVDLVRGQRQDIRFAIPHVETALRARCRGRDSGDRRVIVGRVVHRDGTPVPDANVSASWQAFSSTRRGLRATSVRAEVGSDDRGRYTLCDLPPGTAITLSATRGNVASGTAHLVFPLVPGGDVWFAWNKPPGRVYEHAHPAPHRVWQVDLALSGAPVADPASATTSSLSGLVMDDATGKALEGAVVAVNGRDSTTTRSDGSFHFGDVTWTHDADTMTVALYGYGTLTQALAVDDDRPTVTISVSLQPVDPVLLAERPAARVDTIPEELVGFYRRRTYGSGGYLTPEQIEQISAASVFDLLRRIPGVDVFSPSAARGSRVGAPAQQLSLSRSSARCRDEMVPPLIFVDHIVFGIDDLYGIAPEDVWAVEVYHGASTVPTEFNRIGAACGVIVIWTK